MNTHPKPNSPVTSPARAVTDGDSRVTVRHDGFAGLREIADIHVSSWERLLGWLSA